MAGWGEVVADVILCPLYIYLLIRLATASDDYFKSPFYTFFIATGVYSISTVFSYQIVAQFVDQYWTTYIYKLAYGVNTFGAIGSTIGKALIVIHRYYVIRHNDFAEKKGSRTLIRAVLAAQFAIALVATTPVWPSHYIYKNDETKDQIVALSYSHTLILKAMSTTSYTLYIICNSIFTVLTSREMLRLKSMLQGDSSTTQKIITHQRNMFIVVSVCSIGHLLKASQQV
ncbi:hypothetical protein PENTCL1PPCAC_18927, partial [Pristionchus entomophagus]